MKKRFDTSAGGLVFVGLPLLLVAGCAADKANLAQIDPQTPRAEEQVKSLNDHSAAPAAQSIASPAEQTTPQLAPDVTATASEIQAHQATGSTTSPETQVAASPEPASPPSPAAEAPAPSETQALTPAATAVAAANDQPAPSEKATVPLPQQTIFYFGFNKDEVTAADRAIVKQHAEYLLAHPKYTLLITGHTDNRGPKAYNQRLSEARARKVAKLLEADGVPKQQLRIKAMGATDPMVDAADYQQNRRVEFTYQDAVVAKGQ